MVFTQFAKGHTSDLHANHNTFSESLAKKDPNNDVAVVAASAACPRREHWARESVGLSEGPSVVLVPMPHEVIIMCNS